MRASVNVCGCARGWESEWESDEKGERERDHLTSLSRSCCSEFEENLMASLTSLPPLSRPVTQSLYHAHTHTSMHTHPYAHAHTHSFSFIPSRHVPTSLPCPEFSVRLNFLFLMSNLMMAGPENEESTETGKQQPSKNLVVVFVVFNGTVIPCFQLEWFLSSSYTNARTYAVGILTLPLFALPLDVLVFLNEPGIYQIQRHTPSCW